ncbi:unnamed protein product [Aureobasidium vineae]|uniref:Uncharacterized protein n=1 Tax=Aureobasidium vineae TaxID=2773715 RepID=A0A9N8J863_9PEZI|nr:unnamed protein product [Aureobasidium vineae]
MDALTSALYTSAIIALSIILAVALIAATWTIGTKLAEPFGVILFNALASHEDVLDDQEASNTSQQKSTTIAQRESRKKVERLLSAAIAMFLVIACVSFEQGLAQIGVRVDLWGFVFMVLKGVFEALAALGMLRLALAAVRRLVAN